MRWGDRYGPDYVNRLFAMVARNLTLPHRFVCLTDDPGGIRPEVECRPLPAIELADAAGALRLAQAVVLLGPELDDLEGQVLFLDLDLVIVGEHRLPVHPSGGVLHHRELDPAAAGASATPRCSAFEAGAHRAILQRFCADAAQIVRSWPNEQTYLTRSVGEVTFWPRAGAAASSTTACRGRPLRPFMRGQDSAGRQDHRVPRRPETARCGPRRMAEKPHRASPRVLGR